MVGLFGVVLFVPLAPADTPESPNDNSNLNLLPARSFAPLLGSWIVASRDAAIAEGVERIPPDIADALAGYVPSEVLRKVRWRAGGGTALSLQQTLFRIGDYPAVTLDYVIVFLDDAKARDDPKLWAHELKHVMQYAEWGVAGFAERYLEDYEAVEREAAEFRWEWMKQAGLIPPPCAPRGCN